MQPVRSKIKSRNPEPRKPKEVVKVTPKPAPVTKKPSKERYNVVVIGGGPAGMMAAGRAAEVLAQRKNPDGTTGGSVLLIEKNQQLGKKLLITGGGRCNMTNFGPETPDTRAFLAKLGRAGKFLFSAFAQHSVTESLDFFHSCKVKTKVENEGRVFPVSDQARSVYDALVSYMKAGNVEIVTDIAATGFHAMDGRIVGLNVDIGAGSDRPLKTTSVGDSYILATGGTSHPDTGSTGEGFEWLRKIGHTVVGADAALVPIKIKEAWVRDLAGVSHQRVALSVMVNGKRGANRRGRMVFAHFGMSGPLVLNISKDVREALQYAQPADKIELSLDLLPDITDAKALDLKIQEVFKENQNKKLKNGLGSLVPPAIMPAVITLGKFDGEKEVNLVTREERLALGKLIKDMRMTPTGFLGQENAIVAAGGVKLEEIDFRTMQSRLFPNLYLVGDVLDIDRPSGGYSLQLCWTTGWVAGNAAGSKKSN